jgi:hypothetical protein
MRATKMRATFLFWFAFAIMLVGLALRANGHDWYRFAPGGTERDRRDLLASAGAFLLGLAALLFAVLAHRGMSRGDKPPGNGGP